MFDLVAPGTEQKLKSIRSIVEAIFRNDLCRLAVGVINLAPVLEHRRVILVLEIGRLFFLQQNSAGALRLWIHRSLDLCTLRAACHLQASMIAFHLSISTCLLCAKTRDQMELYSRFKCLMCSNY